MGEPTRRSEECVAVHDMRAWAAIHGGNDTNSLKLTSFALIISTTNHLAWYLLVDA